MVDVLSLASSIVSFIDAASRLKDILSSVGRNDRELRLIIEDIFRGLANIERLCHARYPTVNESQAVDVDLKEGLEDLRREMMEVQARTEKLLSKRSNGFIASTVGRTKAWLRRDAIEAEILRLNDRIRVCYTRFLSFSAMRTEHAVLVNHQEYIDRLEHIEDLVSYKLVKFQDNGHFPMGNLPDPDDIDYQFAHRQVLRLISALNKRGESWLQNICQRPSDRFSDALDEPELEPQSRGILFRLSLRHSLIALRALNVDSTVFVMEDFLVHMMKAASGFLELQWNGDCLMLSKQAAEIIRVCNNAFECLQYERALACTKDFAARTSLRLCNPSALSFAKDAAKAWQDIYDRCPDVINLFYFVHAVMLYDSALFREGHYDESLDCSRQVLLSVRMSPAPDPSRTDIITWSASGEADVVFSSEREISRAFDLGLTEGSCLWNLAKSLAFAGRFSEARIAAEDAVRCYQAFVAVYPFVHQVSINITRYQLEMSTWISIVENPTMHCPLPTPTAIRALSESEGNSVLSPSDTRILQ